MSPFFRILTGFFSTFSVACALHAQQPRLIIPENHTQSLNSVRYSPDGRKLVTTSMDHSAKVWDVASGELLFTLNGHTLDVWDAAFSFDNEKIATAGGEGNVKIWDAHTGVLLLDIPAHTSDVWSVAFSPDGNMIASGSTNRTVRISDVNTGKEIKLLHTGESVSKTVEFSSDNNGLLYIMDSTAIIWDIAGNKIAHIFAGRPHSALAARFASNDEKVITLHHDSLVGIWDVASRKVDHLLRDSGIHTINRLGESQIITVTKHHAKIWDIKSGHEDRVISFAPSRRSRLDFKMVPYTTDAMVSPDGKKLLYIQVSELVAGQLSLATGETVKEFSAANIGISTALFGNDSKKILVTTIDGSVRVFDRTTGNSTLVADYDYHGDVRIAPKAKFLPGEKRVAVQYLGDIEIFDVDTKQKLIRMDGPSGIEDFAISPNGTTIAVDYLTADYVDILDLTTLKKLHRLKEKDNINSIDYSASGHELVTACGERGTVWDVISGKIITTFKHWNAVNLAKFYGDSIVAANWNELTIYSAKNGRRGRGYEFDTGIFFLSVSPDHEWIAFDQGNSLMLFNSSTRQYWKHPYQTPVKFMDANLANWRSLVLDGSEMIVSTLATPLQRFGVVLMGQHDFFIRLANGYYYSTPYSAKTLSFVNTEGERVGFDQMDFIYNRPDLVLRGLGNNDTNLIRAYEMAYVKRLKRQNLIDAVLYRTSLPKATITNLLKIPIEQAGEQVRVAIQLRSEVTALKSIQIWVNEVPLYGAKGHRLTNDMNSFDTTISVILLPGLNKVEVSATNMNGLESHRARFHTLVDTIHKDSKLHFIGIGIDKFSEPNHDLNWSIKDIRDLAKALKQKYGDNILIDTLFDKHVTIANVSALKKKFLATSINDKAIIAYSGHGLLSKDFDYYLSTYNVDFEDPKQNGLPYEVLEGLLDSIPARQKLLLIDACHSGEVDKEEMEKYVMVKKTLEDSGTRSDRKPVPKDGVLGMKNSFELMQELFVNVGRSTGATVISAAAGTQFAQEKGTLQNGVFTFSILEYMKTHPTATVSELRQYVNKRVSELTQGMQVPTTRSSPVSFDWKVW